MWTLPTPRRPSRLRFSEWRSGKSALWSFSTRPRSRSASSTDRDLVLRALSHDATPCETRVGAVMTRNPRTVSEAAPIEQALSLMRSGGFRRLPVVRADGTLVGLISLDDILSLLAEEFAQIGSLVEKEMPSRAESARLSGQPARSEAEHPSPRTSIGSGGRDENRPMRAGELMSQPVVTIGPETSLAEAARTMVDYRIGGSLSWILRASCVVSSRRRTSPPRSGVCRSPILPVAGIKKCRVSGRRHFCHPTSFQGGGGEMELDRRPGKWIVNENSLHASAARGQTNRHSDDPAAVRRHLA